MKFNLARIQMFLKLLSLFIFIPLVVVWVFSIANPSRGKSSNTSPLPSVSVQGSTNAVTPAPASTDASTSAVISNQTTAPDISIEPTGNTTPVLTVSRRATAAPQSNFSWWQPTTATPIHWHWQLSDNFVYPQDVKPGVTVYDIDGETTSAQTVAQLHALGPNVKVICYIDAGVYETYRSDASSFPKSVIGNADSGWNGSYWLDIRQTDILLPIMKARMENWCKGKGFDAVEPDETEVWSNDPGFPITREENNFYNRKIAELAHSLGLAVGLKGNTSETPDLWPYFDFNINEQCWQFNECNYLKDSFLANNKAVFNIEYNTNPDCATANTWHMNSARRDLELVGPTNPHYRYSPCVPDNQAGW